MKEVKEGRQGGKIPLKQGGGESEGRKESEVK
jgi:hypothetical protein